MREFKFRAWDKMRSRMLYSEDFHSVSFRTSGDIFTAYPKEKKGLSSKSILISSETGYLMQSIGLKDSKNVEIYEGDIVRWDDGSTNRQHLSEKAIYWRVAQVVYEPGCFIFRPIPGKSINCNPTSDFKCGSFMYSPDASAYENIMEIIGNIYESPELLAGEKQSTV